MPWGGGPTGPLHSWGMTCTKKVKEGNVYKFALGNSKISARVSQMLDDVDFDIFRSFRTLDFTLVGQFTGGPPKASEYSSVAVEYLVVCADVLLLFLGDLDLYKEFRNYPLDPLLRATEAIRTRYEGLSRKDTLKRFAADAGGLKQSLMEAARTLVGTRIRDIKAPTSDRRVTGDEEEALVISGYFDAPGDGEDSDDEGDGVADMH